MPRLTQSALLLSCTLLLAGCDATAPRLGSARLYQLTSVDNVALPVVINATNGDTTSLLSTTLTLDDAHHALTVSQYHYNYATAPDTTVTVAFRSAWRQHGDSIAIGYFGRCVDLCPLNETGTVIGPAITLTSSGLAYRYQLAAVY
jgi:hypothetical protein